MRVISLTSSNTEIVSLLGFGASLIACDSNSDWPIDLVSSLPRVGPDLQIDFEKVAAFKPDLVLSSLSVPGMERVVDGLNAMGIPQLVLDPITFNDVLEDVRTVAIALGNPERGEALLLEMRSRIQELRASAPTFSRPQKVMIEWWPKPVIVATRDSCRDTETVQMLEVLGAENAFAKIEKRSSVISLEVAIAANPDVICCSWCGVKKLRREKFCLGAAGKKFLLYQKTMSTTCRNHSLVGQVQDCWMVWKSFRACCAACARMTSCKFPSHSRKVMLHWCIEKVLLVACLRFGTRVRLDSQEIF